MAETYCKDVQMPRDDRIVYVGNDWNPVRRKASLSARSNEIINRTIDKYGQYLFPNDIETTIWWTTLGMNDYDVIDLHHAHGIRI